MHNVTNNSILKRGSIPILVTFVGVHSRNIHTEFEANLHFGFREDVSNGILHSDIQQYSEYMLCK